MNLISSICHAKKKLSQFRVLTSYNNHKTSRICRMFSISPQNHFSLTFDHNHINFALLVKTNSQLFRGKTIPGKTFSSSGKTSARFSSFVFFYSLTALEFNGIQFWCVRLRTVTSVRLIESHRRSISKQSQDGFCPSWIW